MIYRNSANDCLRDPLYSTLPTKCQQLKKGYGECKRGLVDMRKRFRGHVPVEYRNVDGADQAKGYQLYGGKSAFGGGVKETDGNEPIPQDWREIENEKYRLEQQQQLSQNKK
jgi:cytochrome c oxidase assembly factor 5